jgi:hypothetical protein
MRARVVWIAIGVRVHGDLAKGSLELVRRRLPSDAQHLVVVALDGH